MTHKEQLKTQALLTYSLRLVQKRENNKRGRLCVESACVLIFLYVSSYWWVHFSRAVLYNLQKSQKEHTVRALRHCITADLLIRRTLQDTQVSARQCWIGEQREQQQKAGQKLFTPTGVSMICSKCTNIQNYFSYSVENCIVFYKVECACYTHSHAHTHAHTHSRTHTHIRTHTHTYTHIGKNQESKSV